MGVFAHFASVGAGTAAVAVQTPGLEGLDSFWSLGVPVRAGILAASTLLLGVLVVGLFPDYGTSAIERVRYKTISSFLIGVVVAAAFAGCIGVLWVAAGQDEIVELIATPFLFVLVGLGTVWTAIGLVGLCQALADLAGRDHMAWGVVGAVGLAAASVLVPLAGVVVAVTAATLGFGAGIRTRPGVRLRDDRAIPPDRKV